MATTKTPFTRYGMRDVNAEANDNLEKNSGNYTVEQPLSSAVPKPNVVRIEVLPAYVRRKYLGSVYGAFDRIRSAMINGNAGPDTFLPFYGILSGTGNPSMELKAEWEKVNKGGFGGLVDVLKQTTELLPSGLNEKSKSLFGRTPSEMVGDVGNAINIGDRMLQMAGLDSNSTGTSTVKNFKSANFTITIPITVKWYMPEQEIQCAIGIRRLMRMAYLRDAKGGSNKSILEVVNDATKTMTNNNDMGVVGDVLRGISQVAVSAQSSTVDLVQTGANFFQSDTLQALANFIKNPEEAFGTHYSLIPLPVRVSIGHTIDVQPMVITDVKIECSDEQFISTICGAHLPVNVTATITVDKWMNVAPSQEWLSMLGIEQFGSKVEGNGMTDTTFVKSLFR